MFLAEFYKFGGALAIGRGSRGITDYLVGACSVGIVKRLIGVEPYCLAESPNSSLIIVVRTPNKGACVVGWRR